MAKDTRSVKKKIVNGKEYSYFEGTYGEGKVYNSIQFYSMNVDEAYFEFLKNKNVGGMAIKMLGYKQKKHDADRTTIMMYTNKHLGEITYVLVEKEGKVIDYTFTDISAYHWYIHTLMEDQSSKLNGLVVGESLDYIDHPIYGNYLSDYKSPVRLDDTGVSYGQNKVQFGDTLILEGCLDVIPGKEQFDRVIVKMRDFKDAFGCVAQVFFERKDGSLLTYIESFLLHNDETKDMTPEEYIQGSREKIKEKIKQNEHKRLLYERQLAQTVLDDEDKEPYSSNIGSTVLCDLLNHSSIKIVSHESKYD